MPCFVCCEEIIGKQNETRKNEEEKIGYSQAQTKIYRIWEK